MEAISRISEAKEVRRVSITRISMIFYSKHLNGMWDSANSSKEIDYSNYSAHSALNTAASDCSTFFSLPHL